MSNAINSHNFCRLGNLVDYAIVTHSNPPIMLRSSQFAAPDRPRIVCETAQSINHAELHVERKSSQVLLSRPLDDDTILRLALRQAGKHLLQRTEVKLLAAHAS